jgi:hypothetical protein
MPIIYGQVGAPSNTSAPDGSNQPILQGKSGEFIDSNLHGKYYTSAYRGKVYVATTLIAGVTLPVNTTTAPTYTVFNPASSGVNLELISLDIGWPAAATTVVATILGTLLFQTPTSTTAGNIYQMPYKGTTGGGQAQFYTAATIVASTTHIPLLQVTSTADAMTASHYDFDGRIVLAPGSGITLTSTPVQTGVAMPLLVWAEYGI